MAEGWTGKPCRTCKGARDVDEDGQRVPCPDCGGTGEEWGELPEDGPRTIKEPPDG